MLRPDALYQEVLAEFQKHNAELLPDVREAIGRESGDTVIIHLQERVDD